MPFSGIGAKGIGYAEETTWGLSSGIIDGSNNPDHWLDARGGMETVGMTVDQTIAQDLSQFGTINTDVSKGFRSVEGNIDFDVRYGGGWLMFLGHLLGQGKTDAGSDPYTHTFTLGADPSSAQTAKGIAICADRDGTEGGTKSWVYSGIRPTSMNFTFNQNGLTTCSATVIGKAQESMISSPTPTYSTLAYIKSPSDKASPTSFCAYGGADYVCKSGSLNIAVPWELRRDVQAQNGLVPSLSGQLEITGSVEVETPNSIDSGGVEGNAFSQNYQDQTLSALVLSMNGADGNHNLAITLSKILITADPTPHASGPELQTTSLSFKAFGQVGADEGSLVLTNTEATSWS